MCVCVYACVCVCVCMHACVWCASHVCVHMQACACVCACVCVFLSVCVLGVGVGECLITNLYILIPCVLMSVVFSLSMKCTHLGLILERALEDPTVIIMHVDHIRIQQSSNVSVIIMNLAAGGRPHCPRLLLTAQPLELCQVTVPVAEGRQGSGTVWHRYAHGHQDGARSGHGAWQNWVRGPASWVWGPQPPELDGWGFN